MSMMTHDLGLTSLGDIKRALPLVTEREHDTGTSREITQLTEDRQVLQPKMMNVALKTLSRRPELICQARQMISRTNGKDTEANLFSTSTLWHKSERRGGGLEEEIEKVEMSE